MDNRGKKVVLYNPNPLSRYRRSMLAPLALLALSKLLDNEGYDMRIVTPCLYPDPFDEVLKSCEDAICLGISSMTGYQILDGLELARLVRRKYPKLPIVWGGWHPSLEPEQTLESPYVDIVVKGQGERTFTELVHTLEAGGDLKNVLGISYKDNGNIVQNAPRPYENINNFPSLPYHLIDVEKCLFNTEYGSRTINYISTYGCPYGCRFCEVAVVYKRRWSGLEPIKVVDDIERLVRDYRIDAVGFRDNNFFVDKERVRQFCEGLRRRDLRVKWGSAFGNVRQLLSFDDELWGLMTGSGLYHSLVGAESGLQDMLDFIDKKITVEDIVKFTEKCRKFDLKVTFSFFIGVPWDKDPEVTKNMVYKEFKHTLELVDKLIAADNRHRIILSHYTPYPGSPLYYKSLECGFTPPKTLEGWGDFRLERGGVPWIPVEIGDKVELLTTYIFFFMDTESYGWVTSRIKNVFLRLAFKAAFRIFEKIVHLRWKYKFFRVPIDYYIYSFARSHGTLFGFYES